MNTVKNGLSELKKELIKEMEVIAIFDIRIHETTMYYIDFHKIEVGEFGNISTTYVKTEGYKHFWWFAKHLMHYLHQHSQDGVHLSVRFERP